ncbi:MAG: fimbrial assembly protein [Gallionellales bacterium GWA2_60_142]|jgi:NAD-dependent DNA ligase|nr:MAG: fimbrial assembly protein [Gallionellales bacterium GWA2_60_142]HCI12498.1 fimbrial assembly protein [Gallionellaceae bacterium]
MSQQINLFDPSFVRQRKQFSLATILQGLGLIVVGAAGMYGYAHYQVQQLELQSVENMRRFDGQQLALSKQVADFSPQRSNQALLDEIQNLEQQAKEQSGLVDALKTGGLGNSAGYSEYMRAFSRQVVPGLWLTGFSVSGDGTQLVLSGAVTHPDLLPQYIQRLRREAVMQGKNFAALQMQQPKADKSGAVPRYVEFVLRSSVAEVKE